jgi:glutamate synthase domain-containing protein 3
VPLERHEGEQLIALLERHERLTGSARARLLLADPESAVERFRRLAPRTELAEREAAEQGRLTA